MSHSSKQALLENWLLRVAEVSLMTATISYVFSRALLLVSIYIAIASWLLYRMIQKKRLIPSTPLNVYLYVIVVSLIISIAFGGNWHEGMRGMNKWLRGLLVFWLGFDLLRNGKIERQVVFAFWISFMIASFDGIFQYFSGKDLIRDYPVGYVNNMIPRITSSFGYFGMFASFLIMVMPIAIAWALQRKARIQAIFWFLFVFLIGLLNLYWTRSRGAWLSFVGMIFLLLILTRRWKYIAALSLLVGVSFLIMPKHILFHHQKAGGFDKTINQRVELWHQAINIIRAHPIIGCGLNTYVQNIQKYNPGVNGEVSNYYAHNGYLQHTAETGMVGLFALLALLFRYYQLVFSKFKDFRKLISGQMIILSVSGFLFYVFFDTIFHNLQPFLLFWLLFGWSVSNLDRMKNYS